MTRIEKLREKAELTRHIHGELERKKRIYDRVLYTAVQIFGITTSIVAAVYLRVTGQESSETPMGNALLWMVMIFPAIGTSLVILDSTVFRLRDQEEKHRKGVELWGDWIRKANGILGEEDKIRKKLEKRYRKCMKETPNISVSPKKFNWYKRDWIEKKNQSIELDKEKKWDV